MRVQNKTGMDPAMDYKIVQCVVYWPPGTAGAPRSIKRRDVPGKGVPKNLQSRPDKTVKKRLTECPNRIEIKKDQSGQIHPYISPASQYMASQPGIHRDGQRPS